MKIAKNVFVLLVVMSLFAALTYAAAPEKINFKSKKGDVAFDHKAHEKYKDVTCKTCHHKMTAATPDKKCRDCHKVKVEGKTPCLKNAMHKQCKDCHKKAKKGPTKCKECHVKK